MGSQYFMTALTIKFIIGPNFEDGPEKRSHILGIVEGRKGQVRIFGIREQDQ